MNIQAKAMKFPRTEAMIAPAARLLRLMSNPHRLLALCELRDGECSVGELGQRVGIGQSALSQHLAHLRREGLVATRREAQTVFYSLKSAEVRRLIHVLHQLYCNETA